MNNKSKKFSGLKEAVIATICTMLLIFVAIEYLYYLDKKNWQEDKINNINENNFITN